MASAAPDTSIGFTTGTAAAAAAKLAVTCLVNGRKVQSVTIKTPAGYKFEINGELVRPTSKGAVALVRKYAGDDPDVTDNMKIGAFAYFSETTELLGGYGIGRVTKPGLEVPPGRPAINPGPSAQILQAVQDALDEGPGESSFPDHKRCISVKIFAPEGKQIAKRTMNSRLGIIDGISVIGTTGIVRPMSVEAHIGSLKAEVSVAVSSASPPLILVPGNIGERAVSRIPGVELSQIVHFANYPIELIEHAASIGCSEIVLFGHIGKLVKIASGARRTGHLDTGMASDVLLEWLSNRPESENSAGLYGSDLIAELKDASSAEGMLSILRSGSASARLLSDLAAECAVQAKASAEVALHAKSNQKSVRIGSVITDLAGAVVGTDEVAIELLPGLARPRSEELSGDRGITS